ncbi:MAG: hypothetical protein RCH30_2800 [Candidatus Phytoplasma australasiaticum]|nr:hypothetical protein EPWB_v2c3070 ['Echinacea purpurea' witches'-broom phytoplasma]WKV64154.1 MAG: hypothetical protein NCHU2022_c3090 [Candidatus Phytoplasma australasiaticum]WMW50168.1 MAG: hypothetical protein RCH30_2800 [Candidatus Phytoplasma australasiaticum]
MNQKKDIKKHNSIIKYKKNCDEYQSQLISLLLKTAALKIQKSLLDKDKKEYPNSILSELNSLYEIASAEG